MIDPDIFPSASRPLRRPAELEDWLNARFYHPLAARLARLLAHTRVTPDMVSATGAATIMLAALVYAQVPWPWGALLGLALHMIWHILDGADGDLARMTERASPHGELVDGICDYAGHIVLYLTLGCIASAQIGTWGWALMWAAGASRAVQASHYEGARRQYSLAVYGTAWMASYTKPTSVHRRQHPLVAYYLWLTGLTVPHSQAMTEAARDPARREQLREAMRALGRDWLGMISPLSSNYRTLAIGASVLAGQPHWFFLFEVVVLGIVLAFSMVRVRHAFGSALYRAEGRASTSR